MPVPNLLLGTRHLRRDIEAQSQQLGRDIERVKFTTAQLRRTLIARATSPLGLLTAGAAGFAAGKIAARPSRPRRKRPQQPGRRTATGIAPLALAALRAIGIQVVLPLIVEWAQVQLLKVKNKKEPAHSS